jgi:hypothetical protein
MAGLLKGCFEDHKTPLWKRIFRRLRPLEVAKMLNSIEDAHIECMSTFEANEHLRVHRDAT